MLARVRRTIAERCLLQRGDHVLVACSGGGDSVALAHLLSRLRTELSLTLVLATVDHGLRPEAADEAAFVEALGAQLDIPSQVLRVTVPEGNLQAEARRARYDALLALAQERGAGRIATGHTIDDQAETVLARIVQGAGVAGVTGIQPRRADGIVRPLIDCRREALRTYLREEGLDWVDDPSNEATRFERVRYRALLPELEKEDPQVVPHLAALADEARQMRQVVQAHARRFRAHCDTPEGGLRLAPLRTLAVATRREILRSWLRERLTLPLRNAHLAALERLVSDGRGEVLLGDGWGVSLVEGDLRAEQRERHTRSRSGSSSD